VCSLECATRGILVVLGRAIETGRVSVLLQRVGKGPPARLLRVLFTIPFSLFVPSNSLLAGIMTEEARL
jgi:hypothetical protein